MTSKRLSVLALLVLALPVLAACGGGAAAPTSTPLTNTQPTATTGAATQPTSTTAAQATQAPPTMTSGQGAGKAIVIAMYQEPESLNPYLSVQTVVNVVSTAVLESLLDISPDGSYIPALATEVPSVANGGISPDGLTITYTLRSGIKWADSQPFTSADVKFTWQAIMDNSNAVVSRAGYEDIASIDTPSDATAVIKFKKLYAPALILFNYVLPKNAFGGSTAMTGGAFNRKIYGTGPYMVREWTSGESIVLDPNPNYRDKVGQGLIFRITPSREQSVQLIQSNGAEVVWDLIEASIPDFQGKAGLTLWSTPSSNVEYLGLNLSQKGDPADPTKPHPILGDKNVRQAISLAIDRNVLVRDLMYGKSTVATSAIGMGWAADPTISIPPYSPDQAKALLDQAGWAAGSDGIRAKGGQRLTLEITSTTGNKLRELAEQVLQQQLAAVGIELKINNVPSSTMFGKWDAGGPLQRGNFDISMDTWGPDIDPDAFVSNLFQSSSIPSAKGAGWNYFRLNDPAIDAAVAQARSTVDVAARKKSYAQVARLVNESYAYIPLYNRLLINAFTTDVTGWTPNPWEQFTWDAAKWQHK